MTSVFQGIAVSSGVAQGRAFLLHVEPLPAVPDPVPAERVAEEIERFDLARRAAREELDQLKRQVHRALGERYAGIFEAQLLVLDDPSLVQQTNERIRTERVSARWALKEVVAEFISRLDAVDDAYIRERGGEVADVHRRLQRLLRGAAAHPTTLPEGPLVVVAHTITPSDAVLLAGKQVVGLATDVGGRTSHTAILAEALSLPAVVGLHDISRQVCGGSPIIVDGNAGQVIVMPGPREAADAEHRRRAGLALEDRMASGSHLPFVTRDGVELALRANIEFPGEVERALLFGAQGIGLYRSEFLFLGCSPRLPTAEEHHRTYREIARRVAPHPAVIRTLDLGGEKYFHEVLGRDEPNPVLGLRGIRLCLERPEIFRPQLQGLLRAAAAEPNLRIMLPLVTTTGEVRQVRRLLFEEAEASKAAGVAARSDTPLGVMIEVPAAALAADHLAQEADFFAVGTNDLIQYALAVDRSNESLVHLYQPRHPGLLRMLRFVVDGARRSGIPVSVCGEMAADVGLIGLLVGLGYREFSVHPRAVGSIREALREIDSSRSRDEVDALLERGATREIGPPIP